jgi:hypothetical protein
MNAGVMVRIAASLPPSAIAEIGFRCDSARHGGRQGKCRSSRHPYLYPPA